MVELVENLDMFAQLPSGFPALKLAVQNMRRVSIEAPPDVATICQRLRKQYSRSRMTGYSDLPLGAIRKLPYAYFMQGQSCLADLEPDLVRRYWQEFLPAAMKQPRRAKRWFTPLFFIYCQEFNANAAEFKRFAQNVFGALAIGSGDLTIERMRDLQKRLSFFQPDLVGSLLAGSLLSTGKRIQEGLEANFLWPDALNTPLVAHAFASALNLGSNMTMRPEVIERILTWSRNAAQPRYPSLRVDVANSMLLPWSKVRAPESIRTILVSYFVKHYGDPRLLGPANPGHHWQGVSQDAISIVRRWLAGDTLRGFLQILQRTADEIWQYREKFWMAYYDAGHIDEAWLVLGDEAALRARQIFGNQPSMTYGRFTGGATPQQSVLLLKIGGLVFSEWSHNGSLRAYRDNDPKAPRLYDQRYHGVDLRDPVSLDFHRGQNERPQLTHAASSYGTWQRKARDFINRETGQYLSDRAIVL